MVLRHGWIVFWGLFAATSLVGCGSDEDSESSTLVTVNEDAGSGTEDAGSLEAHVRYCQTFSKAKCDYVFRCTSGGYIVNTLFGLPGSTAERCAEQASATCLEDMENRLERGTVQFTQAAIDVCAEQIGSKSCPGGSPEDWSTQWHEFVSNVCGGVARGSVQTGDACERRTDCAGKHEHCLDGQCRMVTGPDLHQPCTPDGVAGTLSESSECTTGWCVNTGYGGNCTVDCRDGRGCIGDGFACLHLSTTGGPSSAFCLTPCSIDAHCSQMACLPIDPMDVSSDTYCLGSANSP